VVAAPVGSAPTARTRASPYATPIVPPRSFTFNAKATPRRPPGDGRRNVETTSEEVLALTPPQSMTEVMPPPHAAFPQKQMSRGFMVALGSCAKWLLPGRVGIIASKPVRSGAVEVG
jgi:hypothetical protein